MDSTNTVSDAGEASTKSSKKAEERVRHCKNLDVYATAKELETRHKVKMEAKKMVRAFYHRQHRTPYISANLGRNHPDYGMSMKDHLAEKQLRASEKSS